MPASTSLLRRASGALALAALFAAAAAPLRAAEDAPAPPSSRFT